MKHMSKKIPRFKNEDEEIEFWDTHSGADYFDRKNVVKLNMPNLKPSTERITLRVPKWLLENIRTLANKKDVPYQSLIKMYLSKMITEERKLLAR